MSAAAAVGEQGSRMSWARDRVEPLALARFRSIVRRYSRLR
jgi:hypothetical protein